MKIDSITCIVVDSNRRKLTVVCIHNGISEGTRTLIAVVA
jgi:hypothetical protein